MVNGWLRCGLGSGGRSRIVFERNFATKTALTNEIIGTDIARSRFGPADSWVIKAGAHFPKFVLYRGTHLHELRKAMGKAIDSSAAFYLKFLDRIRRLWCRNFK